MGTRLLLLRALLGALCNVARERLAVGQSFPGAPQSIPAPPIPGLSMLMPSSTLGLGETMQWTGWSEETWGQIHPSH